MKYTLAFLIFCITSLTFGQYGKGDSNRIGISVGLNQFDLNTNNFTVSPGNGWNAGLSVRGNFYNNFDMVYGIQFSENNFTVATTSPLGTQKDVNYKLPSAQISLLVSYKIIPNHLSVEFGPMFQVNGKTTLDKSEELNIVNGTTAFAKDITEVSTFNFYPTVGITAGVKHFRVFAGYQYGLTNMLGKMDAEVSGNAKGSGRILFVNLLVYL